jgi:hypothetical protein
MWMSRKRYNQYGAAALSALAASAAYVMLAAAARNAGLEFTNFAAGFMASVLFLVPGFPLVGGSTCRDNRRRTSHIRLRFCCGQSQVSLQAALLRWRSAVLRVRCWRPVYCR